MFTFDVVATAWFAAAAGVFVPSLVFLAAERTAKSVTSWFHGAEAALSSRMGPLSHH
jgi:hypothetical protein